MSIPQYVKASTVAGRLNRQYSHKQFDTHLLEEYCAQVEVEYVCDVDNMWEFRSVPLTVGFEKMVLLPCNVYKIIELYNGNDERLIYNKTNTHLTNIYNESDGEEVEEEDVLYLSYYGIPVDKDTGEILIPSGHEPMLETFCKVKVFEEDALLGKIDRNVWNMWNAQFSGQLANVRGSFRNVDRHKMERLNIIQGNMLQRIGRLPLRHEQFEK